MKLLKKISSVFIALSLMLSVVCFVSAAPASEAEIRQYLNGIQITDVNTRNKKAVSEYPDVVNVVTAVYLDLKVDQGDFNTSDIKRLGYYLKNPSLDGVDNPQYVLNGLLNTASICELVSKYRVQSFGADMGYSGLIAYIKDNNDKGKKNFYWINKENSKKYIQSLIDGKVSIDPSDYDDLFLKSAEQAVVKYIGDVDALFSDDAVASKFVESILKIIKNDTGLTLGETEFKREASSKRTEAVDDYKKMGKYLVKNTLETKGLEEGKDYEIVYDDETGYIKEIKKLSSEKSKDESSAVSESGPSDQDQLMKNIFIVACILLVVIVIVAAVIVVYALIKRKR